MDLRPGGGADGSAVSRNGIPCCRAALFLRAGGVPDSAFRAGGGDEADPCTRCGMGR